MVQIAAIHQPAESQWQIVLDDGIVFDAEFDAKSIRIRLSSEIGSASPAGQETVKDMALSFNGLQETGGIRIGTFGPGGPLLMHADVHLADISLPDFAELIQSFHAKAGAWHQLIKTINEGDAESSNQGDSTVVESSANNHLRV